MIAKVTHKGKSYNVDLSKPIDISIPLRTGDENVKCLVRQAYCHRTCANG